MDWGRSCYRRRMRFVRGELTTYAFVRWFFAAPTAKIFPGAHWFCSGMWDNTRGESNNFGDDATQKHVWRNGSLLNRSDGTRFAGPLEYFFGGCPAAGEIPRGFDGTPIECLKAPFGKMLSGKSLVVTPMKGNKLLSGLSISPVIPGVDCNWNPAGTTLATLNVTVAGATGTPAVWNGTWPANQIFGSPCFYNGDQSGTVTLSIARPFGWSISFGVVPSDNATYRFTVGFGSPTTYPFTATKTAGSGNWPATISVG